MTTLHLPTGEMGQLAARALVRRLDEGVPIAPLRLPAQLVLRASTAHAPGRSRR